MKYTTVKCSQCGANLEIGEDESSCICPYCRSQYINSEYRRDRRGQNGASDVLAAADELIGTIGERISDALDTANRNLRANRAEKPNRDDFIDETPAPPPAAERDAAKLVTFVLCLFLGAFGAHKFYQGKIGTGILYLFTLGLFYIGWIVDIFGTFFALFRK